MKDDTMILQVTALVLAAAGMICSIMECWPAATFCFAIATCIQSLRLVDVSKELKQSRALMERDGLS